MKNIRVAAIAATIALATAAVAALGASTIRFVAAGHTNSVRAVQVNGAYYLNADDVARALGNGATFDAGKRTFVATSSDRGALVHMTDRVGGGFASDGTVAARLVSVKSSNSFQGNAPDPGAHFVMATLDFKNLSTSPVSMYKVETSMVAGSTHLNDGQLYDTNGNDLPDTDVAPGQTVRYLDVFELNDGVSADAILLHPPFAPTSSPVDILLKL